MYKKLVLLLVLLLSALFVFSDDASAQINIPSIINVLSDPSGACGSPGTPLQYNTQLNHLSACQGAAPGPYSWALVSNGSSTITINGQACATGSTCNVNAGATSGSVALNQGNGSALIGANLSQNSDGSILASKAFDMNSAKTYTWTTGTTTLDLSASNFFIVTASGGNPVIALNGDAHGSGPIWLQLINDSTARSWTLPSSFNQGCAPAVLSGSTIQAFTYDGTYWWGNSCSSSESGTFRAAEASILSKTTVSGQGVSGFDSSAHLWCGNDNASGTYWCTVPNGVSGDVVDYNSSGYSQDSGTLLSSLAPKASPTFTGTATVAGVTSGAGTVNLGSSTHTLPMIVVSTSGNLPGTCTAGEMAFVTGATAGQNTYQCGSTNTWTQQLNSGSGGGNTYLCNGSASANTPTCPGIPSGAVSYTNMQGYFVAGATSTGAMTLNVASIGTVNVYLGGAITSASNTVTSGQMYPMYYDGTEMQLINSVVASTYLSQVAGGISDSGTLGVTGLSTLTGGFTSASSSITLSGLGASSGTPNALCLNTSTVTVNASLTCTVSSARFKTRFSLLESATPLLMKLTPEAFAYKDRPERIRWGFIAEQVASVDPKLGDGFDAQGPRSIDQNAILALTVRTVQEQQKEIEKLKRNHGWLRKAIGW